MASKKYAVIEQENCVACGTCENACPLCAVKVYRGCFAKVDVTKCVGCGKCARLCPTCCIELRERETV